MRAITFKKISIIVLIVISTALASCAQYQVRTNKALNYSERADRLFVWSAVGTVGLLDRKPMLGGDSFVNYFHGALRHSFEEAKVAVDIRPFVPKNDTIESLVRFEQEFNPRMRLMIQPTRYQILTVNGSPSVSGLWLDLSMYEIATKRRVWRGQLFVDPALDVTAWTESGAKRLAIQVINVLKKDGLI